MSGVIGKTLSHNHNKLPLALNSLTLMSHEEKTLTPFDQGSMTLDQVSSYGVAVGTDQEDEKVLLLIYTSRGCIKVQSLCNESFSKELMCNSLMSDFDSLIH
mmetsp:Transcript_62/g.74  ORF Transcript_62/g.74 Transcript_62/m.74 type:complete len:102 (+) Transcript_62:3-308(+)